MCCLQKSRYSEDFTMLSLLYCVSGLCSAKYTIYAIIDHELQEHWPIYHDTCLALVKRCDSVIEYRIHLLLPQAVFFPSWFCWCQRIQILLFGAAYNRGKILNLGHSKTCILKKTLAKCEYDWHAGKKKVLSFKIEV